jgi:hypothetical protein
VFFSKNLTGTPRAEGEFMLTHRSPHLALLFVTACSGGPDAIEESSGIIDPRTDPTASQGSEQLDFSGTELRRLSRTEVRATLSALFPSLKPNDELIRALPDDSSTPFDNDSTQQVPTRKLIDSVRQLAEDTQSRALADATVRAQLVPCKPAGAIDDMCLHQFVKSFGRRALRRSLSGDEIGNYVKVGSSIGAAEKDFNAGVGRIIASMLQDIEFLYRVEVAEPLGEGTVGVLSDFAVATRMSYLLWGTSPDDALLDRAEAGKLRVAAERREAATAMLSDARARAQVGRFHAAWIGYDTSLPQTSAISPELRDKLRKETDALIERVVFEKKGQWTDLFRADETFIDDALAKHYGDISPPGSTTATWTKYGSSQRRGILGHGSLLNVANKFADTSPTQRGKMIRERLLCSPVPHTPPELKVNTDQPPAGGGKCSSDRYRTVLANPSCSGCHKNMDTVGFGLERFDLAGKFRKTEPTGTDCPIDGQGSFGDGSTDRAFSGPGELGNILVTGGGLETCLQQRVFEFTMGHPKAGSDETTASAMLAYMKNNGGRLDALLVEMVAAPSFALKTLR